MIDNTALTIATISNINNILNTLSNFNEEDFVIMYNSFGIKSDEIIQNHYEFMNASFLNWWKNLDKHIQIKICTYCLK